MCRTTILSELPVGSSGRIFKIMTCPLRARLIELGFTHGTKIAVLHDNIGGSLSAYYVRGAVIALRKEDSCNILVGEDTYV